MENILLNWYERNFLELSRAVTKYSRCNVGYVPIENLVEEKLPEGCMPEDIVRLLRRDGNKAEVKEYDIAHNKGAYVLLEGE